MQLNQFLFFIFLLTCFNIVQAENNTSGHDSTKNNNGIVINLKWFPDRPTELPGTFLEHSPVEFIGIRKWETVKQTLEKDAIKWAVVADEPMYIKSSYTHGKKTLLFVAEPGDSVTIITDGQRLQFAGKGAEKFRLKYYMDSILASIPSPANPADHSTKSLEDYIEWHHYLNRRLELIIPLIDSYKSKLSNFSYHRIRASFIDQNIDDRSDKFGSFTSYAIKNGLSSEDISAVYDSTYYPAVKGWFKYASSHIYGNWRPIQYEIYRKCSFRRDKYPMNSELNWKLNLFDSALKIYTGIIREKFIADFFLKELLGDFGFISETEKILKEYYTATGFPEYKKFVKEYEINARERLNGKNAPDFILTDTKGNGFSKLNIKGKITVFDFWFTGCVGCAQMTPAMKKVEETFKNDTNVVFVSISIDANKEKWLKSIVQKKYTTGGGINLYTGGKGADHAMIRQYAITGYPAIHLMDVYGRIIRIYPKPDPRGDGGKSLIELIQKHVAVLKDGPYVLHENEKSTVYSINGPLLLRKEFRNGTIESLPVQTDSKQMFDVSLKKELAMEPSEFQKAGKLLALSDIEGNFDALRKLLQKNNVIDEQFNWVFGDGHLVFGGDMFDRGNQVTECLWLLYSLEEKAKAVGGYVHFILGNHEIMNLYGDHDYVQPKYKDNAIIAGITLKDLYGEKSELGRWLRTKNIIEKIGPILFVHGGIAKEFSNSVSLSISEINNLARKYLGKKVDARNHPNKDIRFIYSDDYSPFWFRTYYDNGDKHYWLESNHSITWVVEKPDDYEMNDILEKWKVKKIITGHTIVADTISIHYGGKLINTDTKHAEGRSEALLIEGEKYYRVNTEGERVELVHY